MNDKAYCIRSNKFMDKPCTNTDCDRHVINLPPKDEYDTRVWALFMECKDYKEAE